jgi:heme/copper-type cytochrome/quinol oxidase subunit 1
VNVLFIIQHLIGIEGHPRRVFLSPEIFVAFHNFANMALPMLVVTLQLFSYVKFSSQRSSPRLVPFSVNGLKSLCG